MGWAARLNPCGLKGKPEHLAREAMIHRFAESFATRQQLEAYLDSTPLTDVERGWLERYLPAHLQAQGSV